MTPQPCIACGADAWAPRPRGLVRCEACGFVRAAEIPPPDALAALYRSAYFEGEEYTDYLGDAPSHFDNFRRRFARLTAIAGRLESLYEIGCAYGLWLSVAAANGVRVGGIDISVDAVRHATSVLGVPATAGDFADAAIAPGAYAAYCMWDTIEHLAHPEAYVAKVASLLPPGGWLFLTTGDIGAPLAVRQGERWRMIHPPTHLQYFSRDSIARFLARHGLRVEHVESTAMCRSVHGMLGGLARFGTGPQRAIGRLGGALLPAPIASRWRFAVDLGDIMLVAARKA